MVRDITLQMLSTDDLKERKEFILLKCLSNYNLSIRTNPNFYYNLACKECLESPEYHAVPCISDPVAINMSGENLQLLLLYLIHELVHSIMQFDQRFSHLSLDEQEAAAYFVGNRVLEDILGENASSVIEAFTIPWPYDFPRIAKEYEGKINLDQDTILGLINKGIIRESR